VLILGELEFFSIWPIFSHLFINYIVKNVLSKTVIGEWLQYSYILLAPLLVEQKIRRTESETRQSTILLVNTTHFDEMRPKNNY
jgi:hypothetical protein